MGNPTWERPDIHPIWTFPCSGLTATELMTKFAEGAAAFLEAWDLWVGCWIGENTVDGSDGSDQISWNVKYSIWQGFILVIPEPSTVWKTLKKVAPKLILGQVLLFPLQQWLVLCTGRSDLSALQLLQWIRGWETENYKCKDRCIHRFTAYLL